MEVPLLSEPEPEAGLPAPEAPAPEAPAPVVNSLLSPAAEHAATAAQHGRIKQSHRFTVCLQSWAEHT
jgi:hypothetical protein